MSGDSSATPPEKRRDSRERILAAAAQILSEEGMAARLSVRKVAERAQLSVGSLRHHFPTQRELREEVIRRIYDWTTTNVDIADNAVPACDRLVACLRAVMSSAEIGEPARQAMVRLNETFIETKPSSQVREAYLAMEDDGQRRMENWLRILAEQGHLTAADVAASARFLNTVLDGLMLKRALPTSDAIVQVEEEILYMAADSVLSRADVKEQ